MKHWKQWAHDKCQACKEDTVQATVKHITYMMICPQPHQAELWDDAIQAVQAKLITLISLGYPIIDILKVMFQIPTCHTQNIAFKQASWE